MQLNGPHSEHEHASVSLKVLLLIFGLILVATLGYFVWDQNTAADTTDNSAPNVKQKATTETAITTTKNDKTTYTDSDAGFSITYPKSWRLRLGATYEIISYWGDTEISLNQGYEDAVWGIDVWKNSTIAERLEAQKKEVISNRGSTVATDLKETTVKVGSETATTFSYKQGIALTMFYFLEKNNKVFMIRTDGSADQMAVAETFTFTK